jgi:plasmid stabilization system protein ParE
MNVEFLADARTEFYEAVAHYETEQTGLGLRFSSKVIEASQLIGENPTLHRERPGGFRRVNLQVFPYYLAYFIRKDTVIIAAVAHGHRKPGYWRDRLPND